MHGFPNIQDDDQRAELDTADKLACFRVGGAFPATLRFLALYATTSFIPMCMMTVFCCTQICKRRRDLCSCLYGTGCVLKIWIPLLYLLASIAAAAAMVSYGAQGEDPALTWAGVVFAAFGVVGAVLVHLLIRDRDRNMSCSELCCRTETDGEGSSQHTNTGDVPEQILVEQNVETPQIALQEYI